MNIYEKSFVKDLFNGMSASYERMNTITSFGFSDRWRRKIIEYVNFEEVEEVVDFMSGMGEMWEFILKDNPKVNITSIDFSEKMVEKSIVRNIQKFDNKIHVLNEDIFESSLKNNQFDCVICGFGLKTFDDEQLEKLSKEVFRVLKPNGQFVFVDVSKPTNFILASFYLFYLKNIIPILGKLFLGNPNEYKMLGIYTLNFKNAEKTRAIFIKNNLKVNYFELFFGCATGIYGRK